MFQLYLARSSRSREGQRAKRMRLEEEKKRGGGGGGGGLRTPLQASEQVWTVLLWLVLSLHFTSSPRESEHSDHGPVGHLQRCTDTNSVFDPQ